MILITTTGFRNSTVELETQNQALLYLEELRREKEAFIKEKTKHLKVPNLIIPINNQKPYIVEAVENGKFEDNAKTLTKHYERLFRNVSAKYPLKVEVCEFDMEGLI